MLLVSDWDALALIVNIFTGINSVPGGYTIMLIPSSPRQSTNASTNPVNSEGNNSGNNILKNLLKEFDPAIAAASSRDRGSCLNPLPIMREMMKPNFPRYPINTMSMVAYIIAVAG